MLTTNCWRNTINSLTNSSMMEVILQVYLRVIQMKVIQLKHTQVMILNQTVVDSQSFHLLKAKLRRSRRKSESGRKRYQTGRKNNQKLLNDRIAFVYHHFFISYNNLSSSCPQCSYLLYFQLSTLGCFSSVLTSSYFHF